MPMRPPTFMSLARVGEEISMGLCSELETAMSNAEDGGFLVIQHLPTGKSTFLDIRNVSRNQNLMGIPWDRVHWMFAQIELSIPSKAKWPRMKEQNLSDQTDALMSHKAFSTFHLGCLRLGSKKPRNKTHVILIRFELGTGLGEIASLTSFDVVTEEEAWKLHCSQVSIDTEEREECMTNYFDLEKKMPVYFVDTTEKTSFLVRHCSYSALSTKKKTPATRCYEIAEQSFKTLQGVTLPEVKLPSLG
jgi:hypothetical protein